MRRKKRPSVVFRIQDEWHAFWYSNGRGGRTLGSPDSFFEKQHTGREAVDEVLSADGAEFSLGEETGQRDVPHLRANRFGIVIRAAEQPAASAVTGEDQ